MAQAYVAIQTFTLTSNSSTITFDNIPQIYTDLLIKFSARSSNAGTQSQFKIRFNGDSGSSNYFRRELSGYGTTANSFNANTSAFEYVYISASSGTTSTFSNGEMYIPNYTGSISKSFSIDNVQENNTSGDNYLSLMAGRWTGTAAITKIELIEQNSGNFISGSTFTLYGIGGTRATGGTITADSQYTYHTFTSSGTFTALENINGAEVLVVAGGGGGGSNRSGGGGAGGLVYATNKLLSAGSSYSVIIGAGGTRGIASTSDGVNGSNSLFEGITALGGGGTGGVASSVGKSGGSGGGAQGGAAFAGGSATQGNSGGGIGYGNAGGAGVTSYNAPGGGGGAGAVGQAGNTVTGFSGNGGNGLSTWSSWGYATSTGQLSGGLYYYAGGGGGGGSNDGSPSGALAGAGGLGGGGNGNKSGAGTAGTANTGGGGGGGSNLPPQDGGNGGSGLVIIRYPN